MTSDAQLGPDETMVAEYSFPGGGSLGRKAVLTSKRLVITNHGQRESHPVSRIRAIRVETGKNWFSLVGLIACAIVAFATALAVLQTRVEFARVNAQLQGMNEGYLIAAVSTVFGGLCLWGAVVAYRGYVRLAVELESETKTYAVQGVDPNLLAFIEKAEHSLS